MFSLNQGTINEIPLTYVSLFRANWSNRAHLFELKGCIGCIPPQLVRIQSLQPAEMRSRRTAMNFSKSKVLQFFISSANKQYRLSLSHSFWNSCCQSFRFGKAETASKSCYKKALYLTCSYVNTKWGVRAASSYHRKQKKEAKFIGTEMGWKILDTRIADI